MKLIFPSDALMLPEELSKVSGTDYALMRRMVQAGCPTTAAGISYAAFVDWTSAHYVDALAEFAIATLPKDGFYSETEQFWILRPVTEWALHEKEEGWLEVGGPGVDGISWAVRRGQHGLFAYYPFEADFVRIADDGPSLISRWTTGQIRL